MTRAPSSISSLVIAGFIAVALSVAPFGLDDNFAPETKTAFAKGKGSGSSSSSGRGGSNRGGGSRGGSSSSSGSDQDLVKGSGNGQGKGQSNSLNADGDPNAHGKLASSLGNLNAAHASPTALEHASGDSIVGLLAAYAEAVYNGDPEYDEPSEQQVKLGEISNKTNGDPVDQTVVDEVNNLLSDYEPAAAEE